MGAFLFPSLPLANPSVPNWHKKEHNMYSYTKWLENELKELARKYPNNMELGSEVRTLIHQVLLDAEPTTADKYNEAWLDEVDYVNKGDDIEYNFEPVNKVGSRIEFVKI